MPECAFCDHAGKLSAEHVTSQWIGELFAGPSVARFGSSEIDAKTYNSGPLDFKAKVVCEKCNNTWMSDIEAKAKPIMAPMIAGEKLVPITPEVARSVANFAFKTAVIVDHMRRNEAFFPRRFRHAFRKSLFIPHFVHMWMCASAGSRAKVRIKGLYHNGKTPDGLHLKLYGCTCSFGNFAFQVLSVLQSGNATLRSTARFDKIAVPFWPTVPPNFVWPYHQMLRSDEDFKDFTLRWENIQIFG